MLSGMAISPGPGIANEEKPSHADCLAQVDCIVQSETFRSSGVLRRLLKFLADKYVSGESEQLKEYTVAVEALGRASTYDPRHDSAVRIQASRLRQKLAEYYRTEGKNDDIVMDLPKGHFNLTFESRPFVGKPGSEKPITGRRNILLYIAVAVSVAWAIVATVMLRHERTSYASADAIWSPALKQLWRPFVTTDRPLIFVIEDPLFFRLQTDGDFKWFRDPSINDRAQEADSSSVKAVSKALNISKVGPEHFYTPISEVTSTLLLGKLLGTRQQNISLARTSQVSWQDVADENVVYIGARPFFDVHSRGMSLQPQLIPVRGGVQNLTPGQGEPAMFSDQYGPPGTENGEFYVVVTHIPGPTGTSDILSFTSNRAPGFVGGVEWFTNANLANTLVEKMRKNTSGEIPLYYQILLKAKFEGGISTQTSYVLHRELQLPGKTTTSAQ
jgi:hypothetical protein